VSVTIPRPSRQAGFWETVRYVVGSTPLTVRFCMIMLAVSIPTSLPVLLVRLLLIRH
jgi:hypothetical protein